MRCTLLLLLVIGAWMAGCAEEPMEEAQEPCPDVAYTFFLQPDGSLGEQAPDAQAAFQGNAFSEAFLTNEMHVWLSEPAPGWWIQGNVTIEFWARNTGSPAPIVDPMNPTEGYHFFNQFGSDRAFQPAYAIEYSDTVPLAGSVAHYMEVLGMPEGGFVVEQDDRLRLLLTSLVTDGADGGGHEILVGGDTPSQVRFAALCHETTIVTSVAEETPVSLPGNRGLLTGLVPEQEGVNTVTIPFELSPLTSRLTVSIRQLTDADGVKDDIDLVLVDAEGNEVWNAGSPYSDETAVLWEANLEALMPPGMYGAKINAYSGTAYEGVLTVEQGRAP